MIALLLLTFIIGLYSDSLDDISESDLETINLKLLMFEDRPKPSYWVSDHPSRSVFFVVYNKPSLMPKLWFDHIEAHVGDIAFTNHAESREIQFRPRNQSLTRIYGFNFAKEYHICNTTKSDMEIIDYMVRNFQGYRNYLTRTCDTFARMLITYACPKKPRFPLRYGHATLLRNAGLRLKKHEGKKSILGMLAKPFSWTWKPIDKNLEVEEIYKPMEMVLVDGKWESTIRN